jgi:hypothetical protein
MFKRFSLGLVIVIVALGVIFIGLDVLDIGENFRLYLPIPILNAVFICVIAALVAYFAAKTFTVSGLLEIWGLGCAIVAFGFSSLLYSLFYWWLADTGLNLRITVNDSGILIGSIMHLLGASLGMTKYRLTKSDPRPKQRIVFLSYLGMLVVIAFVTWLAFRDVLTSFLTPLTSIPLAGTIEVRDVVRGVAAILCVASAIIYFRIYLKSRSDFHYWYSLGLMLFAFGVVFISQGALESRVAWMGRVSQYISGLYFLLAILSACRLVRIGTESGREINETPA